MTYPLNFLYQNIDSYLENNPSSDPNQRGLTTRYNSQNPGFPFPILETDDFISNELNLYNLSLTHRRKYFDDYRDSYLDNIDYQNHYGLLPNNTYIPQPFIGYIQTFHSYLNRFGHNYDYQFSLMCPHHDEFNPRIPCLKTFEYNPDSEECFQEYFNHFKNFHYDGIFPINEYQHPFYEGVVKNNDYELIRNKFLPIDLKLFNQSIEYLQRSCLNDSLQPFYLYGYEDVLKFDEFICNDDEEYELNSIIYDENEFLESIDTYKYYYDQQPIAFEFDILDEINRRKRNETLLVQNASSQISDNDDNDDDVLDDHRPIRNYSMIPRYEIHDQNDGLTEIHDGINELWDNFQDLQDEIRLIEAVDSNGYLFDDIDIDFYALIIRTLRHDHIPELWDLINIEEFIRIMQSAEEQIKIEISNDPNYFEFGNSVNSDDYLFNEFIDKIISEIELSR
ncbi:hypothetical protein BN7_2472 [Wickerhamomyces ciferrii]|uniref:Uncharacterized protein n=1 Tax=Wickerhamomyces ciferrii (strain ATCC 14091 / BCRC 22168 / CBS 111 / JCM 3599 / NBRC 0793 / NRRL Y-1031 F-60-10) TaxID=1206466 RepID=K0KIX2_WICCF|nr:uncharacterized protein BN7_2472 [Wickerhamomyces ciferrii]CCH42926.1 hypothetical protein BN7_2472 [Wickerhamomyces ciferrii]